MLPLVVELHPTIFYQGLPTGDWLKPLKIAHDMLHDIIWFLERYLFLVLDRWNFQSSVIKLRTVC